MTLKNKRAPLPCYIKLCASFQSHRWIQSYSPEMLNSGQNRRFIVLCDLEIRWMTFKNNRAPLLCCFKFMDHFITIGEFKLKLQSGNAQFGSKSAIFLSCVTLKFDGWPWKIIGHLSLATSSFMHHFIIICEFKLELQSGNAKLGYDLCDLDLWPCPFAWTPILSWVITPENFVMIR